MDDVITELKREREALRERLMKIDAAIEDYERWARSVAELVGRGESAPLPPSRVGPGSEQTPVAVFEERVRALLGRASAPMKRADIHDALTEAGVVVGGKDPLNTVAARLSRMDGIINLKGHGYWPEDRPHAPAGHSGATADGSGLFGSAASDPTDEPTSGDGDESGET